VRETALRTLLNKKEGLSTIARGSGGGAQSTHARVFVVVEAQFVHGTPTPLHLCVCETGLVEPTVPPLAHPLDILGAHLRERSSMSLRFDTAEQPSWLKSPPPRTNLDLAAQCSRSPAHCWPRPIICEKVERRRVAGLKLVVWGRRPRCYNSRLAQKRCFPWRRPRFLRDSLPEPSGSLGAKETPEQRQTSAVQSSGSS